jgi:hypothetical protein
MAELSILWETTSGTGDSNISGYSDDLMFQLFRSLLTRTANLGGVSPEFQNKLAVAGSASPLGVNTGAGLCYGVPYFNTASVNVTIPTPASATRIDRIVLRVTWAGKTCRITRIAGTEGGGAPALVQNAGTTWDVPLAQVSITTGAVITITDQREWLLGQGDGSVANSMLLNMADATIKGRPLGAGAGAPQDMTKAQALTLLNVADGADVTAASNVGTAIHGTTAKTTLVSADEIAIIDSAAGNVLKRILYSDLATLLGATPATSWTPGLQFGGSATGMTFSSRSGTYWRLGTLIFIIGQISLSARGSSTGLASLVGLPLTVGGLGGYLACTWSSLANNFYNVLALPNSGSTQAPLLALLAATNNSGSNGLSHNDFNNASYLGFVGMYSL